LQCSVEEFGCNDGGCVSLENCCDEVRNCEDGSDEEASNPSGVNLIKLKITVNCKISGWKITKLLNS